MVRIFAFAFFLCLFFTTHAQQFSGSWSGTAEYVEGAKITEQMKTMGAEKKLALNVSPAGKVSGNLLTTYPHSKTVTAQELADQDFTLSGRYDASSQSLLLVITHFRSKPDTMESYLTFSKPDSVYYDLSFSEKNPSFAVAGKISETKNENSSAEWVGPFRGGGLNKGVSSNTDLHILPLRIRFSPEEKTVTSALRGPWPDSNYVAAKDKGLIQNRYAAALEGKKTSDNNEAVTNPVIKKRNEPKPPPIDLNSFVSKKTIVADAEIISKPKAGKPVATPVITATIESKQRVRDFQRTIALDSSVVKLEMYDNGEVDGDIATLILDGKEIISKQLLSTTPATVYVTLALDIPEHVLELYAHNLGAIPPNTALVVLTCNKKRFEIHLQSTEKVNGSVKLTFSR